jgi:NAD/NADP transhydrogenase beta subunit
MNQYLVTLIIAAIFAAITFIVKVIQKQKRQVIFINMVLALIIGALTYSGVCIIYFVATEGKTLFNEPITAHYSNIGIAGAILTLASLYSLVEILITKEGVLKWIRKEK